MAVACLGASLGALNQCMTCGDDDGWSPVVSSTWVCSSWCVRWRDGWESYVSPTGQCVGTASVESGGMV